jgi:hypothetical protein
MGLTARLRFLYLRTIPLSNPSYNQPPLPTDIDTPLKIINMSHPGMAEDMSSGTALTGGALHKMILDLIAQACEADDVDLIS